MSRLGIGLGGRTARSERQRGSALVMSLSAVVIVMLLALGFTQLASNVVQSQSRAAQRKRAFYLAEAGLAEAYNGLINGKSGNVGSRNDPAAFGDGLFWVEATQEDRLVTLDATGMIAGGEVTLSLVVERGKADVASLGVFSTSPISLLPGSVIDAYDSSEGAYDPANPLATARVSSNGAISVEGTERRPTIVHGSLTPGPQDTVTSTGFVTIEGSTDPGATTITLPTPAMPEMELGVGMVHSSPSPLIVPPGRRAHKYLELTSNTDTTFQGPATLILGSLALASGAELTFDTSGGPIRLWVTDGLVLGEGSSIVTSSTDPSQVNITVPGETANPVQLYASSTFHGVIYAPATELVLSNPFEVFGAVVAETITFASAGQIHRDDYLVSVAEESMLPKVMSWTILDLGSEMTAINRDPFSLLGVSEAACMQPSDAHMDQWLSIKYVDLGGFRQSYDGWESSFDWTQVRRVHSGTRDGEPITYAGKTVALDPYGTDAVTDISIR